MKLVPLTKGFFAQVDDEDYEILAIRSWYACVHKHTVYAKTMATKEEREQGAKRQIRMHRLIFSALPDQMIDHIDGNGLNNQKINLRICNGIENCRNKKKQPGKTSVYKGVSWSKSNKRWHAYIGHKMKQCNLGFFLTQEEAAMAYNKAAIEFHGTFAKINQLQ